jgi:hypothetical protein
MKGGGGADKKLKAQFLMDDTQRSHTLAFSDQILAVVDLPIFVSTSWTFETFSQTCGNSFLYTDGTIIPYQLADLQHCVAECAVDLSTGSPPDLLYHNVSGVIQDIVLERMFPVPSMQYPLLKQSALPIYKVDGAGVYAMEVERANLMTELYDVLFPMTMADHNNNTWYKVDEEMVCGLSVSAIYVCYGFDARRLQKLGMNASHALYRTQIGGSRSNCGGGWLTWCLDVAIAFDFWLELPPPPPPLVITPQSTGLAARMLLWVIGIPLAVLMVYLAVMHVVKSKIH